MGGLSGRRIWLGVAAPVTALVGAGIIIVILLLATGHNPFDAFSAMGGAYSDPSVVTGAINQTTVFYLSAVAVAIGFKMNLFNIGVDGQYRIAALVAAAVAGAAFMSSLPSVLRIILTLLVAVLVGGVWAGIAGWLRVTRGVSEVISTIMLNSIATALIAYLLTPDRLAILMGNNVSTRPITDGGQVPNFDIGTGTPLFSLILLAALVGVAYWFLLNRTVFGFSIKATGLSETAAVASGISVKKMMFAAMVLSGAVAGLVGMPELLNGISGSYSLNFQTGIGFTGIAIALLGRNHPVGIVFASALWSFLASSSNALQSVQVPKELVTIMQGIIVLLVVIAYEIVRRAGIVLEQRDVARQLAVTAAREEVAA
ncbi:MAG TPA: ABC transporter permease [Nakamurella sp.]|nr:ABC transporter permease [Nakamurella sp.]